MHVLVLVDKKIMAFYLGSCLFSGISDNSASHKLFPSVILAYRTWLWQAVLLFLWEFIRYPIKSLDRFF